mmetsp:Transcript_10023/g.28186  ORF Transcript_10023/g.28186 Transcript_10023/m.28186 type:complete len:246 (-) Transcript_10023:257-994(-)
MKTPRLFKNVRSDKKYVVRQRGHKFSTLRCTIRPHGLFKPVMWMTSELLPITSVVPQTVQIPRFAIVAIKLRRQICRSRHCNSRTVNGSVLPQQTRTNSDDRGGGLVKNTVESLESIWQGFHHVTNAQRIPSSYRILGMLEQGGLGSAVGGIFGLGRVVLWPVFRILLSIFPFVWMKVHVRHRQRPFLPGRVYQCGTLPSLLCYLCKFLAKSLPHHIRHSSLTGQPFIPFSVMHMFSLFHFTPIR